MKINQILVRPRITEKSLSHTKRDVFSFEVSPEATKHQVKASIESLFKVHIVSVTSMIRVGKTVKVGRRMKLKKRPNKKIVLVRLKKGERIELFQS